MIGSWTALANLEVVEVVPNRDLVRWERASSAAALDERRFLGVLSRLPTTARPGDWCTLVLVDSLGEAKWTLVAVEPGREESIFQQQRSDARRRRRAATVAGGRAPRSATVTTAGVPAVRAERAAERAGSDGASAPVRRRKGRRRQTGYWSVFRELLSLRGVRLRPEPHSPPSPIACSSRAGMRARRGRGGGSRRARRCRA